MCCRDSHERVFFIYDHRKHGEEADPKDAILFFYPPSVRLTSLHLLPLATENKKGGENDMYTELFILYMHTMFVLLVACLTSQQHASASQGRICSDNFTCCHTQIEVADQTFYLTQSQYTDTGLTHPSADSIMPGTWQGSHGSANF